MIKTYLKHSKDPLAAALQQDRENFRKLKGEIKKRNFAPAYSAELINEQYAALEEKLENEKQAQLADISDQLQGLEIEYKRKMETPAEIARRTGEYSLKYRTMPNADLEQLINDYGMQTANIPDRVELTAIAQELERRGSPQLETFRGYIQNNNGNAPWLKLAGDLPERKQALEKAPWGSVPIKIEDEKTGKHFFVPIGADQIVGDDE